MSEEENLLTEARYNFLEKHKKANFIQYFKEEVHAAIYIFQGSKLQAEYDLEYFFSKVTDAEALEKINE